MSARARSSRSSSTVWKQLGKVAPIDLLVKSPTGLGKMKKAMERATHQDDSRPVGVRRIDITDGGAVAQTGSCFRGTS